MLADRPCRLRARLNGQRIASKIQFALLYSFAWLVRGPVQVQLAACMLLMLAIVLSIRRSAGPSQD